MPAQPLRLRARLLALTLPVYLVTMAVLLVPASASAQVAFQNAQTAKAFYPSSLAISPVAVDAQGDAFYVLSGVGGPSTTGFSLYEVPVIGPPTVLNNSFPFAPTAMAANPQGTMLFFVYNGATTSCNEENNIQLAAAAVSGTVTPANMPCTFKFGIHPFAYINPTGLAVDPLGNLWVADNGGGDLFEIPAPVSAASVPTKYTRPTGFLPYGIAVNSDGNVYFTALPSASSKTGELLSVPLTAFTSNVPGNATPTEVTTYAFPSIKAGLAIDQTDHIFVGGPSYVFVQSGVRVADLNNNFAIASQSLATDANGDLFITGADESGEQWLVEVNWNGVNFGSQNLGQISPRATALNFSVAAGTAVNSIAELSTGIAGKDFLKGSGGSCAAETYATATTCTVNADFLTLTPGQRRGAVVLYDAKNNELANVPLTGIGIGPQLAYNAAGTQTTIASGFKYPYGVKTDAAGNVYVADAGNTRVVKVSPAGTQTTVGTGLAGPTDVAIDGAGNVYIADSTSATTGTIYKVTPAGTQITVKNGLPSANFLALDGEGDLFVAEQDTGIVVKVPPTGPWGTVATGLDSPRGIAVDPAGDLYIADFGSGNVYKVTSAGVKTTAATGLDHPAWVAIDAAGGLYVTETGSGSLIEVYPGGSELTVPTSIASPNGLAVDAGGTLYVSDLTTWELLKIDRADPPALSFDNTLVDATSSDSPKVVTLENIGNGPPNLLEGALELNFSAVTFPADFPESSHASDCDATTVLAPSSNCTLTIDFSPVALSPTGSTIPLSEDVSVITNTLAVAGTVQRIAVAGTETKKPQTISFPPIGQQSAATTLSLSATTTSMLTIAFTSTTPLVCAVSGTTASLIAQGTCTIQAAQAGNDYYQAAKQVSQSFMVELASQTIDFTPVPPGQVALSHVTLTATASSGLPIVFASGNVNFCSVSGSTVTFLTAGTCFLIAFQAGNNEYSYATADQQFNVAYVPQTIVFQPIATQTVGAKVTLLAQVNSPLPIAFTSETTAVCTVAASTATMKSAGTCTIQASQAGNNIYGAATAVIRSFTVTN